MLGIRAQQLYKYSIRPTWELIYVSELVHGVFVVACLINALFRKCGIASMGMNTND